MSKLVVCETTAAITTHLRELRDGEEPNYHGHKHPQPQTLCGWRVGWDMKIPVGQEECMKCIAERERRERDKDL